jgi:hypothetical protein
VHRSEFSMGGSERVSLGFDGRSFCERLSVGRMEGLATSLKMRWAGT